MEYRPRERGLGRPGQRDERRESERGLRQEEKERIAKIMNGDTRELVKYAEEKGKELYNKELTPSQIRNVFGEVKKIQMQEFDPERLLLLNYKLVYAASRPGSKLGTKEMKDILIEAIHHVNDSPERFERFCNFFEALLAYRQEAEKERGKKR
ncbi:MAG: type III-A CRISPR-associated protein Csm2 [Deltaproteobacteria bacterium]|nr:type III-A CRISPR-associated protein Csm2 [Deltaproteobacteria bacterium]